MLKNVAVQEQLYLFAFCYGLREGYARVAELRCENAKPTAVPLSIRCSLDELFTGDGHKGLKGYLLATPSLPLRNGG